MATLAGGYHETGDITCTLYGAERHVRQHRNRDRYRQRHLYDADGLHAASTGTVTGTYEWVASYSGDSNNNPVITTKGDEPVPVTSATLTISTIADPTDISLGSGGSPTLNDSATLAAGYYETGTITFTLFAPNGTTVDTETVTISGNGTYSTPTGYTLPTTQTVTGTYEWVASYSGDTNNNPASSRNGAEPASVDPASPTISTTPNPVDITLNGSGSPTLNDSATLVGGYNETGTITFTLYAPNGMIVNTETATVTGNGTYATPTGYTLPTTGAVTGTYQWVASYSGDSNNNAVTSTEGTEPVSVNGASPTVSTTPNPTSVVLNATGSPTLKDSATLAGGYHETGDITFTLYAPNGTSAETETVSVSGNGTYATPTGYTLPTTGAVTGTYQWVASYSGDGNNNAVTSENGTEPVSVKRGQPDREHNAKSNQSHAKC